MPLNTLADLEFDMVSPDAPGLVLPVTAAEDGSEVGTLRSALVGRRVLVLRWQAFRPNGTTAGPIWILREDAAMDFLNAGSREAARAEFAAKLAPDAAQ